jgi:hypothetical protein
MKGRVMHRNVRISSTSSALLIVLAVGCSSPSDGTDGAATNADTSEGSSGAGTTLTSSTTSPVTTDPTSSGEGPGETSSGAQGDTTAAEDTGDPECGAGIECGVAAPDGWFGPMIIARVDGETEQPACPDGYLAGPVVLDGFVDPGPAECTCECELSASNCYAYAYAYSNAACTVGGIYTPLTETCSNAPFTGGAVVYSGQQMSPTCTSQTFESFPPALWESTVASCKLADTSSACNGNGVCQPIPPDEFEANTCIYQQGDVGCPAGAFNTKRLYSTGVDDNRECGACNCGVPATNCTGNMQVFADADCPGAPTAVIPSNSSCGVATGVAVAMDYGNNNTCPVSSQPQPSGSISPIGAFTFCCQG